MTVGFEVAFPSLVEIAETMTIDVRKDLPIYSARNLCTKRCKAFKVRN